MAANEELINAAAAAYGKRKSTLDFSGLRKAGDSIDDYLDHKIDMKRDKEKRS